MFRGLLLPHAPCLGSLGTGENQREARLCRNEPRWNCQSEETPLRRSPTKERVRLPNLPQDKCLSGLGLLLKHDGDAKCLKSMDIVTRVMTIHSGDMFCEPTSCRKISLERQGRFASLGRSLEVNGRL